jgi:soluble lytic murein transglycosylase-like protein
LNQPIAPLHVTHKLVQKITPDQVKQGTQLVAVSKESSAPPIVSQQATLKPHTKKIPDTLAAENFSASFSANHYDTASGKDPPSHSVKIRERLFDSIIRQAASRYQVDPYLVKAIIMAESSYNPKAISKKGAKGLMQLMPKTAKALGVEDSFNPEHNINAGVKYFKQLLNQFNGDVKLALAAYNAGSKRVKKYKGIPPYKATQYYVKKVFEYHEHFRE